MKETNFKAYAAWIAICIVWGTTYLAIRVGVGHLPPFLFAGFRWLIAGSIFIVILRFRGIKLPDKKDLKHIIIVGVALIGLGNGFVVFGEQWIPSGLASLFITTLPFWIVGIETFIIRGAKLNLKIIIGLLFGLSGVLLIFGSDFKYLFDPKNILGVAGMMFAVMAWSSGTVYSKYKKINTNLLMSASIQMLSGGILQVIAGGFLGEFSKFSFDQNSFFAFTYLIFVGSFIGYASYIYAIAHLPLSLVSTYAYVNPVIALFLGWLVLNEALTPEIILAAIIIFTGVAIVKSGNVKSKVQAAKVKT